MAGIRTDFTRTGPARPASVGAALTHAASTRAARSLPVLDFPPW
ncbi:hypothetical protein [Streptomyces sp. NPDC055632]